ncbi:uncharacterized protein [Coffea arabica]|uniref:Uncharacterized protein n=1 Tax=Coffea arabica TaxID=13443 RepID=A0ABM4U0Z5_COFAR
MGRGMEGIRTTRVSRGVLSRGGRSGPVQAKGVPSSGSAVTPQVTCGYCSKPNYSENNYWRKFGKCLFCGSVEHQVAGCPIGGNPQRPEKSTAKQTSAGGSRQKVPARIYALDHQQMPDATEVVEGAIPVFHSLAKILIDPDATHSFVNPNFLSGIDLKPIKLPYDLEVKTPTGDRSLIANLVYRDCEIWVRERKLLADLIGEATMKLDVRSKLASSALISGIQARIMLSKGAQGYLAFLINTSSDKVNLEDMSVVKDYPNVFPEELESLPPEREITFKIDITPEVAPISKTPYKWLQLN